MSYTLGTAAKATGKSKSTIQRAIQSGRMSATPLEDGSYRIDPAELARVFPLVSRDSPAQPEAERYATANDTEGLRGQVQVLRELIQQIEGERDDLRRRLDAETEAREKSADDVRRLTLVLTHQPQTTPQPTLAMSGQQQPRPEADPTPAQESEALHGPRFIFWFPLVALVGWVCWYYWRG